MHFSRVRLDGDRVTAAELGRMMRGEQYAGHRLLWRLFSTGESGDRDQARPFIFRQVEDASMPTYYLVSDKPPADRDNCWRVDTKTYEPVLASGMRLQFDLRANPVKREKQPDGRHKRHDVVMDAKRRQRSADAAAGRLSLERDAGLAWLGTREERLGFRLDKQHFAADGYRQHVIFRRGRSAIRFSSLDLHGILEISNADIFRQTLFRGVGPSKSFGCGLLLVRAV